MDYKFGELNLIFISDGFFLGSLEQPQAIDQAILQKIGDFSLLFVKEILCTTVFGLKARPPMVIKAAVNLFQERQCTLPLFIKKSRENFIFLD